MFVNEFTLEESEIAQLAEENMFVTAKIDTIIIKNNQKLRYISPKALSTTWNVTKEVYIQGSSQICSKDNERDLFDIVNMFSNMTRVGLEGNDILKIPDRAFRPINGIHKHLKIVDLNRNNATDIGDFVFSFLRS